MSNYRKRDRVVMSESFYVGMAAKVTYRGLDEFYNTVGKRLHDNRKEEWFV